MTRMSASEYRTKSVITLPWPPKECSPNARVHWATKARAAQQARSMAHWRTIEAVRGKMEPKPVDVTITFHPPDKRPRDRDNMIASFKNMADGVADGIGVDDALWRPTYQVGDVRKGGEVVVQISEPG